MTAPATRRRRRLRDAAILAGVVVALVALNVAAYASPAQLDLSASRRFSLTSETVSLVHAVKAPLQITAFLNDQGGDARDARFLLARYHQLNRHVGYRIVDPDTNPGEAKRFGITRYATVVLTYRGQRVDEPDAEELEVSAGILRLLRGGTPTLCYLVGHGEPALDDTSPVGASSLAALFTHNDYRVVPLDLSTAGGSVPSSCAAVIVMGPTDPLLPAEISAITGWTHAGGRLLVLATPLTRGDPNPLLSPWGIHFAGGLVLDPARDQGLDLSNVIIEDFPSASPVDNGVSRLQYPAGGGLVADAGTRGGLTVERLAVTSGQSWIETQPDVSTSFHPGDIPGPVTVAAAADDSQVVGSPDPRLGSATGSSAHILRARVFATGGDVWATNQFLGNLSNARFLVNAVSWLTQEEQLLAATSRPNQPPALPMTPERRTRILAVTVGAVPGAIVALGLLDGLVLRRRRRDRATAG